MAPQQQELPGGEQPALEDDDVGAGEGAGEGEPVPGAAGQGEQVEAVAGAFQGRAERREPVTVEGDPELLRRAVENVIRNAIRYSPTDSSIEVQTARSNGHAVVDVRDHGPGVPDAALPRLFDPFYRAAAEAGGRRGSGLGLAIARGFVEANGGRIWVESRPGQGTSFVLEFPVERVPQPA